MVFWPSGHPDFWPSSHLIILPSNHLVIQTSGHLVIQTSGYLIIRSSGHPTIRSSDRPVIRPSGYLVIQSSGHLIIRPSGDLTIRSSVLMPQKCPYWNIFGLPNCRLHQSQIPNVLPDSTYSHGVVKFHSILARKYYYCRSSSKVCPIMIDMICSRVFGQIFRIPSSHLLRTRYLVKKCEDEMLQSAAAIS